jgi:hypothetical protein
MLKLLSDLKRANRFDKSATAGVIASGVTGTWVTLNSNDDFDLPASATRLAFPVWTESNRDGTIGWTPDVGATGKLTVFDGYLRAITDQVYDYAGLAQGDLLTVTSTGKLTKTTVAEEMVAVVMRKIDSITVLGTTYTNCIEFTTK